MSGRRAKAQRRLAEQEAGRPEREVVVAAGLASGAGTGAQDEDAGQPEGQEN